MTNTYDTIQRKQIFPVGVLLLNAVLTVQSHQANSHKDKGWEQLTDAVISWLNNNTQGLVFMLWGSYAQKKGGFINKVSTKWHGFNYPK
jgi:uracil DNA glycosylase